MDSIHLINSLKDDMMLMRNSVDSYHDMWYEEALQLASKVYRSRRIKAKNS